MNNFKSETWETVSPEEVPERANRSSFSIYVPAIDADGYPIRARYDFTGNVWFNTATGKTFNIRCWLRPKK